MDRNEHESRVEYWLSSFLFFLPEAALPGVAPDHHLAEHGGELVVLHAPAWGEEKVGGRLRGEALEGYVGAQALDVVYDCSGVVLGRGEEGDLVGVLLVVPGHGGAVHYLQLVELENVKGES